MSRRTQISGGSLQKSGYQQAAGCWDWLSQKKQPQKGGVDMSWDWPKQQTQQKKQMKQQKVQQMKQQKGGCWECKKGGQPMKQQKGGKLMKQQQPQQNGMIGGRRAMPQLPSAMGMSPSLKRKRTHLMQMASTSKRSTANPSYGWSLRSPQKGRARHTLMSKCGSKCFLMPKMEGFPVCAKYDLNPNCKVDCGGILSAYRRARQYNHPTVANSALKLAASAKCAWEK